MASLPSTMSTHFSNGPLAGNLLVGDEALTETASSDTPVVSDPGADPYPYLYLVIDAVATTADKSAPLVPLAVQAGRFRTADRQATSPSVEANGEEEEEGFSDKGKAPPLSYRTALEKVTCLTLFRLFSFILLS